MKIVEVTTARQLREFVLFPMGLFRRCPAYVPPLISDELSLLRPGSPAHETCESRYFMAIRNGEVVGRIAAIVNHTANTALNTQNVRFGWFDLVEDGSVAAALFDAASDWGRGLGMKTISGPFGFTGFDKAGLLVEGFQHVPTIATLYNHPYYDGLIRRCGFEKEMDMVEFRIPDLCRLPEHMVRLADKIGRRGRFRLLDIPSRKYLLSRRMEILDMMDEVFSELYDAFPHTPGQRDFYADKFFPYLNPRLVKVAEAENGELAGFIIAMPSLSEAFQKARGRLFPLGAYHIWRAMRPGNNTVLDFCIGGVRKPYRRMGMEVLMGIELLKEAVRLGFRVAETNGELETNQAIQSAWKHFNPIQHKRRRAYAKTL